jgi:hypothetical protein
MRTLLEPLSMRALLLALVAPLALAAPAVFAAQTGPALPAGIAGAGPTTMPGMTAPLPRLPALPVGPAATPLPPAGGSVPIPAAAAGAIGAPGIVGILPGPSPSATTARRVPGTDGGDIVIEAIPASTNPAASAPSAADPRRAFLESPAAVRFGDIRAEDDSVQLVGVREEGGTTCREYQQTIIVDNIPVQAVGTVCKQKDGTWKLVDR